MHIRQVLVKAELEKYQQYKDVYTSLKKGKVWLIFQITDSGASRKNSVSGVLLEALQSSKSQAVLEYFTIHCLIVCLTHLIKLFIFSHTFEPFLLNTWVSKALQKQSHRCAIKMWENFNKILMCSFTTFNCID